MQVLASSDFGTLTFLSAPYFCAFLLFSALLLTLSPLLLSLKQTSKSKQASMQ